MNSNATSASKHCVYPRVPRVELHPEKSFAVDVSILNTIIGLQVMEREHHVIILREKTVTR